MAVFHRLNYFSSLKVNYKTAATNNILKYTVKYESGVQPFVTPYTVKYVTTFPVETVIGYTVRSTYEYDDKLLNFRVVYTSGVEILDRVERYRVRYISDNPTDVKIAYRVVYNSEVVPTDVVQAYKVTYTSEYLLDSRNTYTVRYTSIGIESVDHRTRWSVKYTSESLGDFVQTYKVKYTTSIFYDNSTMYVVKFTTQGSEEVLTRTALLKDEDGQIDALVEIKGTVDRQMDAYFYVFSNMPKYQLVEFNVGDDLPYMFSIPDYELVGKNIFPEESGTQYEVKGYLLIKDVNPTNSISLDVYDFETSRKINTAKSYFFDLASSSYIDGDITIGNTTYKSKNLESNKYEYGNLNFVYTEVTPIFSPGDSCCFSRKILPPGSPNTSGACSPF